MHTGADTAQRTLGTKAEAHWSPQLSWPVLRRSWTLPPSISSHTSMVLPGATHAPCTRVPPRSCTETAKTSGATKSLV